MEIPREKTSKERMRKTIKSMKMNAAFFCVLISISEKKFSNCNNIGKTCLLWSVFVPVFKSKQFKALAVKTSIFMCIIGMIVHQNEYICA